jgi:hypothetical protein
VDDPDPHLNYLTGDEATDNFSSIVHIHDERYSQLDHQHTSYQYVATTDVDIGSPSHVYVGDIQPNDATLDDEVAAGLFPGVAVGDVWIETYHLAPQPPPVPTSFTATSQVS